MIDHLLMIAFGGPPRPEDVKPFLEIVSRGRPIPPQRLAEVAHHYEVTGGASPYNAHTFRLVERLAASLQAAGVRQPLFTGMRNWHPFLKDTLREIHAKGLRRGLGVVLAPHRSHSSWGQYLQNVEDAKREAGALELSYDYLEPWHDHPLFIDAQADQVRRVLPNGPGVHLVFTAHSIPAAMAAESAYAEEYRRSSELVANALGIADWHLAYQSRSGRPTDPWLEPDILAVLRMLAGRGVKTVVVVPIGFLSDHTEVLYDLDLEAKQEADTLGLRFHRASTVMEHPAFVRMFTELIQRRLAAS